MIYDGVRTYGSASLTSTLGALRVSQGGTATLAGGPGAAVIEYYGTTSSPPPPLPTPIIYDPIGYDGGGAPAWWAQRGVTNGNTPDDYAVVNQGQVKNIAKKAYEEMKAKLPGGAGASLDAIWANPAASTDDYQAINLGQLKNVARPFYDQLISVGYFTQYPWTGSAKAPDDYALANIGQVKNLFSFGFNSSATADGATSLVVVSGDQQVGPAGQVLPLAFKVQVVNRQGIPVAGAPVQFSVDSGGGLLAAVASGDGAASLALVTGVDRTAVAYYQQPSHAGVFSLIHVRAGASQYVFTISSYGASALYPDADGDGLPDAAETVLGTSTSTRAQIVPASTLNLSVYTP